MSKENIFRNILENLPLSKIEIIPDDPKDKEIANQMSDLINWKVDECCTCELKIDPLEDK